MSKITEGLDKAVANQLQNILRQNPKGSAAEQILLGKFLGSDQGAYARNVLGKNHKGWIEHITTWLKKNQPRLEKEFNELDFSDLTSLAYDMYENYLAKQGQLGEGWKDRALAGAAGGLTGLALEPERDVLPIPDPLVYGGVGAAAGKMLYDKYGNKTPADTLQVPPGVNPVDPDAISRPGPYKQPDPFKTEIPSITDKPRVRVNPSTGSFEPVQTKTTPTKTRDPKTGRFAGKTTTPVRSPTSIPDVEPGRTIGGGYKDMRWRKQDIPGLDSVDDLAKAAAKTPIGRKIAAGLGALGTLGGLGYGLVTGTDSAKVKPEVKPASNAKPPEKKSEEPAGWIAPDTQAELDAAAEVERNRNRDLEVDSPPPTDILGAPGSDTAERITPLDGPTGGRPPVGASTEPDILGAPGADTSVPVDPIDRNRSRIRKPSEIYKQPEMTNETPADIVAPVKAGAKGLGKLGAKAIPFVGVPLAAADAAERYKQKDYVGAGLQGAATVAYGIPGAGALAGGGLDAVTMLKDLIMQPNYKPQSAIARGIKEEVVSLEARRSPLVVAGSPYDWDIYDLRTNKMVANILGGDRHDSPLYEIRIRSSGMTPTTRMLPTYVLRAGRNNNPPYKAYELVDTADRYGEIEKSPGPGGTTKLRPDQDDMLRHMFKVMGGGKYYGYDLELVEEGLDQYEIIEKALGAKIMEIDDAMELGYTDWDPEDSSSIVYLGNKVNIGKKDEGYSAGAVGGSGLGEAHPKQQLSLYKPDGDTYRGKPMPNLEKDPVDKARKLSKNIPAELPDPDEDIRQKQLKKTINDLINSELMDREQKVLRAYYFGEKTLEQIAKQFQVHPSRIAQILAKAERKLRHPARASKLRPFVQLENSFSDEERYGKVGAEIRRLDPEAYKNRPRDYQGNIDLLNKLRARSQSQELPATTPVIEPRASQRYPDSGLQPGQQFVDPRNNPGNLRGTDALRRPGYVLDKAVGFDKKGFAIFANPEDGKEAMRRQLQLDAVKRGLTGRQLINKYAPPSDNNDTDAYVKNVFGELGLDPDQKIDPQQLAAIQKLMVRQEHGREGMQYYFPDVPTTNLVSQVNEMEILQRILDKDKKQDKPVANPNAVPKKTTQPKEPGTTDYSKELERDPSVPSKHPLELQRPKIDAEVQKRQQELTKQPKESAIMQGLKKR